MTAAYQAVQSAHALADAIFRYPKEALEWHRVSNTLVNVCVKTEFDLLNLEDLLTEKGMKFVSFREPDIGDELTAIAIIPCDEAKKVCSGMPLALKNYAPIAQLVRAADSKSARMGFESSRGANGQVE